MAASRLDRGKDFFLKNNYYKRRIFMTFLKINQVFVLLSLIFILSSCQTDHKFRKGFTVEISHTSFLEQKTGWTKVYSFEPFMVTYQPDKKLMIFGRGTVPDSLHMFPLSKAEQEKTIMKYGDFHFLGAFEDHNLPAEMSHLFYVNPSTLDILQVDRITSNAKGDEKFNGAIMYMRDSINLLSNDRLFSK
jgi:hypothetical protein